MAHGESVTFLHEDWESLVDHFMQKHGVTVDEKKTRSIHDSMLPSHSYFDSVEERLHDGRLKAETLAHDVSLQEEQAETG